MFLQQLENSEQAELFVKLAMVVMGSAEAHDQVFQLNQDEQRALEQYEAELENTLNGYRYSFDKYELEKYFEECFENQANSLFEKYKDNPDIKEQVIANLTANNEDLLALSRTSIEQEFIKLPKIQIEFFNNIAQDIIEEYKASHFDEKIKKIIVFELIGAGFCDGNFDENEKHVFYKICQCLDVEEDYVDEFLQLAKSFFTLTKDITDLINE